MSRRPLLLLLQRLGNLLWRGGMLFDQDLTDALLLRKRVVERFARDDAGLDEDFTKGFGVIVG